MFWEVAFRIREWLSRHPSDGCLLSFRDGELSKNRRAVVARHLQKCEHCQSRARDIEKSWNRLAVLNAISGTESPAIDDQLLEKIRSDIHAWSKANPSLLSSLPAQNLEKTETGRKVAEILSIYLGQRAAAALLHAGDSPKASRREQLAGAELTLSALLGRKCAAAIETRLRKIMEEMPSSACEPS